MNSLSIWDQKNRAFIRRGFKAARFISEFKRTKKLKIVNHSLGEVKFNFRPELNSDRNRVIDRDIKKIDGSGFTYGNVGNVYFTEDNLQSPDANGEYSVLAHGEPIPGDLGGGNENCIVEGMICTDGTNKDCKPGKCLIGKLKKISNYKWKYTSASSYNGTKLEYFIGGKEFLELKTIIRGSHQNPDGTAVSVDKPASKNTTVYLPPVGYAGSVFSDTYVKFFNLTMALDNSETLNGVITTEEDFIRQIIDIGYKNFYALKTGPTYSSICDSPLDRKVVSSIEDIIFSLPEAWRERVRSYMGEKWDIKHTTHETNREFITTTFRYMRSLFTKTTQVTRSGLKRSSIRYISDESVRPIYLRLPASSNSYRPEGYEEVLIIAKEQDRFNLPISSLEIGTMVATSDRKISYQFLPRVITDETERRTFKMSPLYSSRTKEELYSPRDDKSWSRIIEDQLPKSPVAKWMLAGADEFLREKKYEIEDFYYTYLDPTECSPKNLDWLAQHVGLSAPVWNTEWATEYKRALIKNSLGWFDKELVQEVNNKEYKTIKGEVLSLHPFNAAPWRDEEDAPDDKIDLFGIDLSSASSQDISVYKKEWGGLGESKGSILTLIFLFSLFKIKAHTEGEIVSKDDKFQSIHISVKSGLRAQELDAPILLPTKYDMPQVGTLEQYRIGSFENQLVADRTKVTTAEEADNIFFRLPFYYNRDGKSWDLVQSVANYWVQAKLNSRVQYAYLAAGLWKQGDAFFDPGFVDTASDPYILSEERDKLLTEFLDSLITEHSPTPLDESILIDNITSEGSNILLTESSDPLIDE